MMIAVAAVLVLNSMPLSAGTPSDCTPLPLAMAPYDLAYAGPDSAAQPAHALVILRSRSGDRRDEFPWKAVLSVDLVPERGAVLSNAELRIETYAELRQYIRERSPDSSYAVFSFVWDPSGKNYRIVLNQNDESVPEGCTPIIWHKVIGEFSER